VVVRVEGVAVPVAAAVPGHYSFLQLNHFQLVLHIQSLLVLGEALQHQPTQQVEAHLLSVEH
jgi:hypothetical protein